jgi:hypothetical protein
MWVFQLTPMKGLNIAVKTGKEPFKDVLKELIIT